jgi:hypothetical protein
MATELMPLHWPQAVLSIPETCRRLQLRPNQVRRLCVRGRLISWRHGAAYGLVEASVQR